MFSASCSMDLLESVTPGSMALHEPPLVKYLHLSDRSIAYRHLEGRSPTLVYVGGFLSTMEIHKATIIEQYAKVHGRASIRYDQARIDVIQWHFATSAFKVTISSLTLRSIFQLS